MNSGVVYLCIGAGAYGAALLITKLFLVYCRKKYKRYQNCAEWYSLEISSAISGVFPGLLFWMFFLGMVTTWVLKDAIE